MLEAMGADERPASGSVVDRLLAKPQGYDLFQAISLLERAAADRSPVGTGSGRNASVRLRSVVSLGFQPSDVSKVVPGPSDAEAFTLHTAVMSLAGANGPLPIPFTEMVLERSAARDHATADFLDIFNHRFLAFLYRSRKKHHVGLNGLAPHSSALASCLDALSALGLRSGVRAPGGELSWLEHAGLMGGAPRSLAGLLAILSGRLGLQVRGSQFCGGWRDLEPEDLLRLGSRRGAPRLGRSAMLGRRVWDQAAGIRIEIDGLSMERLQRLLRGGAEHSLLHWLVRRYLAQDMEVEVVLRPRPDATGPTVLGRKPGLQLGWTSWLQTRAGTSAGSAGARMRLADQLPQAQRAGHGH